MKTLELHQLYLTWLLKNRRGGLRNRCQSWTHCLINHVVKNICLQSVSWSSSAVARPHSIPIQLHDDGAGLLTLSCRAAELPRPGFCWKTEHWGVKKMLFTCAYQICTDFDYEVRMDVGFFRCFIVGQQCIVFFCPKVSMFWLCRPLKKNCCYFI